MRQLINGYVYQLPDGSRVLAFRNELHSLHCDTHGNPVCGASPDYDLDASGMILFAGKPTGWMSDDLLAVQPEIEPQRKASSKACPINFASKS